MTLQPLKGTRLVTLALNVPGPVAAARLVELGTEAIKVEPPSGDPLKSAARAFYDLLSQKQTVVALDLKSEADRRKLDEFLEKADLLLTSFRPSALKRLPLASELLPARYPVVCVVIMVGYPPLD